MTARIMKTKKMIKMFDLPPVAHRVILIFLSFVIFIFAPVFAFLNSVPVSVNTFGTNVKLLAPGLFKHNMEVLSDKYPIDITPAGWVFAILWPLIYFWNFISATFILSSLFIRPAKNPILRTDYLLPNCFFYSWMLAFASIVGWLFSFDSEIFELSLYFLAQASVCVMYCLGTSYRSIQQHVAFLKHQHKVYLYLVRILIHNGLGVFCTWITAATLLNLNVVIVFYDSPGETVPIERGLMSAENSGTIMLGILLAATIVWFMLENFVFESYCRFTLSIFPTLLFATSGLYIRNRHGSVGRQNPILSACLMGMSAVGFLARYVLFFYRYARRVRQKTTAIC